MLILARKSQEAVVISGAGLEPMIKVTVLEVRGSSVKLGFEAGDEVPIHRAEVWERIRPPRVGHPILSQSSHGQSIKCPTRTRRLSGNETKSGAGL